MEGLPGARLLGGSQRAGGFLPASGACSLVSLAVFPLFSGFAALRVPLGDASPPVSRIPRTGRVWTFAEHQLCGETARGGRSWSLNLG